MLHAQAELPLPERTELVDGGRWNPGAGHQDAVPGLLRCARMIDHRDVAGTFRWRRPQHGEHHLMPVLRYLPRDTIEAEKATGKDHAVAWNKNLHRLGKCGGQNARPACHRRHVSQWSVVCRCGVPGGWYRPMTKEGEEGATRHYSHAHGAKVTAAPHFHARASRYAIL